jgi:hypothetical protein
MEGFFGCTSCLGRTRSLIVIASCAIGLLWGTLTFAKTVSGRLGRGADANVRNVSVEVADTTAGPGPAILASTFLGGTGFDITWACAADASGNVYIAGDTQAADFPVTNNAFQKNYGDGGQDGFIAKYDKNGRLLWSTFLGGSDWDGVFGLTVDGNGNAVVTGVTASTDFPITANAVQNTLPGGDATFVTVIKGDGTGIIYSTYLGGSTSDGVPVPVNPFHALPPSNVETIGVAVSVGSDGTIYVVGGTNATDLPATSGAAQPLIGGEADAFVARIRTDVAGSAGLLYLTYLGGATNDLCSAIVVDHDGNAFLGGQTQSPNFPTTLGAFQQTHTVGTAAFVTKLNPAGTALIYSTLLSGTQGSSAGSGNNASAANAIALDADGHAYIAGSTNDTDFPATAGVVQSSNHGIDDGFVAEFETDGSTLVFATYLGGSEYEGLFGIKLDQAGNIFVGGFTSSRNLTLVQPFQPAFGGFIDSWVAELSPGGTALLFSSYLGGTDQESVYGLDLRNDELYLAGRTASADFPVTKSAAQATYGGGIWDNFLTTLDLHPVPKIISIDSTADGHIVIRGEGTPLVSVTLETSPDLTADFVTLKTVTVDADGTFHYDDPDAITLSRRFYRASYR